MKFTKHCWKKWRKNKWIIRKIYCVVGSEDSILLKCSHSRLLYKFSALPNKKITKYFVGIGNLMLKLTWKHIQLRIAKRTLKKRNRGWHGSLEKRMLFTTVWAPTWDVHRWMSNDWQCLQHVPLGGWYALECPVQFQLALSVLFLFQSYAWGRGGGLC